MTDRFDPERFEPDPLEESDGTQYESMAPQPRDPTPSPPEAPSAGEGNAAVDPGLKVLFWRLVLLYKFSLMGLSLGLLLVVFGVSTERGGWLFLGALGLFGYALYETRRARERIDDGEFDADGQSSDQPGDADQHRNDELLENDESTETTNAGEPP